MPQWMGPDNCHGVNMIEHLKAIESQISTEKCHGESARWNMKTIAELRKKFAEESSILPKRRNIHLVLPNYIRGREEDIQKEFCRIMDSMESEILRAMELEFEARINRSKARITALEAQLSAHLIVPEKPAGETVEP